jgi:uncharacterized protein YjdB
MENSTLQLMTEIFPAEAGNLNLVWSSNDPDCDPERCATVSQPGLVSGISSQVGPVAIKLKSVEGGISDTFEVTVKNPTKQVIKKNQSVHLTH